MVEDEAALLPILTRLLGDQGYTVLAANTPADALELANEHGPRIDLLVTDIVMPGLNGLDLGREIGEAWPSIKRLFMSGYSADMIARYGRSDEVAPLLQKPFTMAELMERVRAVLDGT